jgi:glycosyltransferase involved in cell wall biosynthesis
VQPGDYRLAGLQADRRYVLIFGNLRGYKGVPTLLRAWKRVVRENADTDLLIAGRFWNKGRTPASRIVASILGSGKTARIIKSLLEDDELRGRVILREQFVPDEVIDACCRVADLAVFPYDRFSGQSGAATRAVGWGTPLIVSRTGALPDLAVSSDFVCIPGDDAGLARKLLSFLSASGRSADARRKQLSRIEPYYWDHIAQQHHDMYADLAAQANV